MIYDRRRIFCVRERHVGASTAAAMRHADAVAEEPVRLVVVVERDLLGAAELRRIHELGAGQRRGAGDAVAAAGAARAARPHAAARRRRDVPRRLGGALGHVGRGVRRFLRVARAQARRAAAERARPRAERAAAAAARALGPRRGARVDGEQRAHLPRELRAPVSARYVYVC